MTLLRSAARIGVVVLTLGLLAVAGGLATLLATGHRPIVLTTGSMRPTAPPGTLIIAEPRAGGEIVVGDVVVMRRPDSTPVTHRVVELVEQDGVRAAITQGDANDFLDAAPYLLTDREELVARWYVADGGRVIVWLQSPTGGLAVVGLLVLIGCSIALRWIWSDEDDEEDEPAVRRETAGIL